MPASFPAERTAEQRLALLLTLLMVALPWSAAFSPELSAPEDGARNAPQTVWGGKGSNDTGWVDMIATGADLANGTYAYSDLYLDFAPGAEISNLTFQIAVNGSDGYWATEPQLTLLDTQTPILDWRGYGDLGRQDVMENNPPTVQNGTLDTYLRPNSISDASWELPAGVTLTDMVIEALRPADPKISFSALDVALHDSAVNPFDGRLYVLLDDDLLHLDDRAVKPIIDIENNLQGRSLAIDADQDRLLIGTEDGLVLVRRLSDSAVLPDLKTADGSDDSAIHAIAVDAYGTTWAAEQCTIHHRAIDASAWTDYDYCLAQNQEIPSDILIVGDRVYLATESSGVHLLDFTTTSASSGVSVVVDNNIVWNTQNYLASDLITDLAVVGNNLMIATYDAGINRRDLVSQSWLATWSTGNWLASNQIHGLAVTEGWLHILAGTTVHAYDTNSLIFRSQRQLDDMGLLGNGESIISWPAQAPRGPTTGTALVSDGSGTLARLQGENTDGSLTLVSSPTADSMQVTAHIDDGEQGEIWIAGNKIIDRFDESTQIWQTPIDISDYVSNAGQIIAIEQDSSNWVWIGTTNAGILRLRNDDATYIGTVSGLSSTHVSALAFDPNTDYLVVGHPESGISIIDTNALTLVDTLTTSDGLDSDYVTDIATRYGIAYIATPDVGVMRVELSTSAIIGSWQSLGADNLDSTPIAVDDDIVYIGLFDFGILVIDRMTGDITEHWNQDSNTLPDDDVHSLQMDDYGGLLVGAQGAFSRYDGSAWHTMTSSGGWWNRPTVFYDVTSDADGMYAGTNRGACMWNWQYQFQDCVSTSDGMPSRFVYAVDMLDTDRLYAGTNEGAAIINMDNFTVIETWTAGDDTQRSRTVKIGDILYLGFENTGIARYDLMNNEWLTTWDGTQGYIDDDDVTVLVPGLDSGTMWAGGDFGLTLIDVVNDEVLIEWSRGANAAGPTLSNTPPAEIEIHDNVLHYSLQRSNSWWSSSAQIYRINLTTNSSMTTLDAGAQAGWSGVVHGIGVIGDQLWIGVRPTQYWNNGDGTIVRWNMSSEAWEDDLATIGNVRRVNARFLGDCFPLNASSCELWIAYGDYILRRFNADSMQLLNEWTDIEGPIRGMAEFQGEYLFASMNGILRWDPVNSTWLDTWMPGDGLPSSSEEEFYSMAVINSDLWLGTMESSGFNSNAQILRMNGSSDVWSSWDLGTGDIPDGYAADIKLCDDIVHFAIGARFWWGNQGGIARYDLADHDQDSLTNEWISSMTSGSTGLSNNDPRALACDEANRIMYIGFDTEGVGFDRYNYNTGSYLSTLTSTDGISMDRIFPGGMHHENNVLLAGHQYDNQGGISRLVTSGTATANGQVLDPGMDGCSIERAPSNSGQMVYAIGRSGQTTGMNRVDRLDNSGLIASGFDELAGLSSGRVVEIISNETHVWISSSLGVNSYYGSSVLQGEILSNGSVRWEYGYNFQQDIVNEMLLDDETLWVTTAGRGLKAIDLQQRRITSTPPALHTQMDGMILENGSMYIGLMGNQGSAAGFQIYNTGTNHWGHGSLLAGLPSNLVRDFIEYGDHILIATHGGIGMWNTTRDDWDDPITTIDGLPSPIIEHLFVIDDTIQGEGKVLAGGAAGLTVLHQTNLTVITTLGYNQGLMGNTVSGITYAGPTSRVVQNQDGSNTTLYHDAALFISHNGRGPTRPGAVAWDIATDMVNGSYNIDMIPSNDVRAVASDDWGVHIATDTAPLVHWNGTMMKMETGVGLHSLLSWPPFEMHSDGNYVVVMSPRGIDVVEVDGMHSSVTSKGVTGLKGGYLDSSGLYVVGDDGLHVYDPVTSLQEKPREHQRRADPLTVLYGGRTWDITDTTHPGMATVLVTPDDPIQIPQVSDVAAPGRLPMHTGAMTLTAPQGGAWVWARSSNLNYSGTWDLAAANGGIEMAFQSAISAIGPGSTSATLHVQLQSPADGAIKVRVTYDWQRVEVPTVIVGLEDRPNDGGGVIEASWLPAEDAAWFAYRLYVWDSTDEPLWEPTANDIHFFSTYIRSTYWSHTNATVTQADHDGVTETLQNERMYRAAIAIEYADGTIGDPMTYPLNVTPTDEVPAPPAWMSAEPVAGGASGTVIMEWSACTELDPDRTRLWAVQQEITSAIGLTSPLEYHWSTGNTTALQLQGGVPYWFAAVCVDEAGQSDPDNATIIGPVVTAGGLDDGIPPAPITGTTAADVPDDEGGRLQVNWEANTEEDCTYYAVYILPASGWQAPSTVDGWPVSAYINDCSITEVIIDSLGESGLVDDVVYWVGVVAFDDWGNGDVDNVFIVEATPISNVVGAGAAPDRVTGLDAWDHPEDDGGAIDIRWNRSAAEDFDFYTIWISEYPLDDISDLWDSCKVIPSDCGLITVDQRQFGADFQLELTITKALYGDSLETLNSETIEPMIPLYVTVTIHDLRGNVHLEGLNDHMVIVTPIDNRGDISPPDRLAAPVLSDRGGDSGDAMFVEFQPSSASDIAEYRIYAVIDTPILLENIENLKPSMVIDREQHLPILLTTFSARTDPILDLDQGDLYLVPNRRIYVAVVAVDSSGNAWVNNLATSWIEIADELSADPCPECPDVSGIRASWNAAGSLIEVNWDASDDPMYSTYHAYVSLEAFIDTRNATLFKEGMRDTILIINEFDDAALAREETYWIEIVTFNGDVHTFHADPVEVPPWSESSFGTKQPGDDPAGDSWVDRILSGEMNMIVALLSVAMLLVGAILFIKPREDSAPAPWEMGAFEVELEEQKEREAAGLSDDDDFTGDFDMGIGEGLGVGSDQGSGLVASARRDGSADKDAGQGADESYSATAASAGIVAEEDIGPAPSADSEVVDELLGGPEEEVDIDDLDDFADELDLEDLDDLADDLSVEDEDVDTSFLDDML